MNKTAILLCKCRGENFIGLPFIEMEKQLLELNIDLYTVSDLCAISLTEKQFLASVEKNYSSKIILACHKRAVISLFNQQQILLTNFSVLNFRDRGVKSTFDELLQKGVEAGKATVSHVESNLEAPSWFPIIDQERCTACGRCAKFCLFGVYRFEEKKLSVQKPLNCKNNCPACARTCPASAIIFPKIPEGGVIAGAEQPVVKSSVTLASGSLASRLTERNAARTSILKAGLIQQAEKEKQEALKSVMQITKKNDDQTTTEY